MPQTDSPAMDGDVVELDTGLCARLGLLPAPAQVRVLTAGSRTVVLERVDTRGPLAPGDRPLVLSADVASFQIAEVFQMIHASGKSGFLLFEHRSCTKSVYLHDGEVVFATSDERVDRLDHSLARAGIVDEETQRAASVDYSPPGSYGRFLVERGLLTPRELWEGVKIQVEEIVRSLFAFGAGQVHFWEGEVRPDNVVRLALPTGTLAEEGLAEREALVGMLDALESRTLRLRAIEREGLALDESAARIVRGLSSYESFSGLCAEAGVDPLSGARMVRLLERAGAVQVLEVGSDSERAHEEDLRESVHAHVKLLAALCAPIAALEGPEPIRARVAEVALEAATRHPEVLEGIEIGPGGGLDVERLIERVLYLPGDGGETLRMALGELISYAEFELLNHPGIDGAAGTLAGLASLRERL